MQVKDSWEGRRWPSKALRLVQEGRRRECHAYNHLEV